VNSFLGGLGSSGYWTIDSQYLRGAASSAAFQASWTDTSAAGSVALDTDIQAEVAGERVVRRQRKRERRQVRLKVRAHPDGGERRSVQPDLGWLQLAGPDELVEQHLGLRAEGADRRALYTVADRRGGAPRH